jgi:hypothetical protein
MRDRTLRLKFARRLTSLEFIHARNFDDEGRRFSYTLPDLAQWFNVPETPLLQPVRALSLARSLPAAHGTITRRATGWKALRARRLNDLETLMELRGGQFKEGCRYNAVALFAALTRGSVDHVEYVSRFACDGCVPALPLYQVRGALVFGKRWFRITDLKIGEWLKITPAEAANLAGGDKYLRPRVLHQAVAPLDRQQRWRLISEMYAVNRPPTIP